MVRVASTPKLYPHGIQCLSLSWYNNNNNKRKENFTEKSPPFYRSNKVDGRRGKLYLSLNYSLPYAYLLFSFHKRYLRILVSVVSCLVSVHRSAGSKRDSTWQKRNIKKPAARNLHLYRSARTGRNGINAIRGYFSSDRWVNGWVSSRVLCIPVLRKKKKRKDKDAHQRVIYNLYNLYSPRGFWEKFSTARRYTSYSAIFQSFDYILNSTCKKTK